MYIIHYFSFPVVLSLFTDVNYVTCPTFADVNYVTIPLEKGTPQQFSKALRFIPEKKRFGDEQWKRGGEPRS